MVIFQFLAMYVRFYHIVFKKPLHKQGGKCSEYLSRYQSIEYIEIRSKYFRNVTKTELLSLDNIVIFVTIKGLVREHFYSLSQAEHAKNAS